MSETTVVTDAKGRKLSLRKLTVLDQAKMLRAIASRDPRQTQNQPYVQMVECVYMVADIDGVPLPLPTNEQQIDNALDRLGDEGMAVLYAHRIAEVQRTMAEAEAAATGRAEPDPLARSEP